MSKLLPCIQKLCSAISRRNALIISSSRRFLSSSDRQQTLEKMEHLQSNPFYEKYSQKLKSLQQSVHRFYFVCVQPSVCAFYASGCLHCLLTEWILEQVLGLTFWGILTTLRHLQTSLTKLFYLKTHFFYDAFNLPKLIWQHITTALWLLAKSYKHLCETPGDIIRSYLAFQHIILCKYRIARSCSTSLNPLSGVGSFLTPECFSKSCLNVKG